MKALHPAPQCCPIDAKFLRSFGTIALMALQGFSEGGFIEVLPWVGLWVPRRNVGIKSFWKMFRPQLTTAAQDHHLLQKVEKFSNIAWIIVMQQHLHHGRRYATDILPVALVEPVEGQVDQQRNVFAAIA